MAFAESDSIDVCGEVILEVILEISLPDPVLYEGGAREKPAVDKFLSKPPA